MLKDNGSQKSHWFRGIQLLLCFRNALHIYALSPSTDLTILAQAMKHNACLRGRHQHCSSRRLITLKMKRKKTASVKLMFTIHEVRQTYKVFAHLQPGYLH